MSGIFKLEPCTFKHFYNGGRLRAEFFGESDPKDDFRSESWIWSTTVANTPGRQNSPRKGFSKIIVPGSKRSEYLSDYLAAYPYEMLGEAHYASLGANLGVLLKVFNTGNDTHIPVHWHPTPEFAKKHLQSDSGKNEAWYILSTGDYGKAWVGWQDKMSASKVKKLVLESDVKALRSFMHEIHLVPGKLLGIPAGIAHSIGPDVCVLEPQEPTDFSFCGEPKVFPISEEECHMGLGWDLAIEAVDLNALSDKRLHSDILCTHPVVHVQGSSTVEDMVTEYYRPYFWLDRIKVRAALDTHSEEAHCITVIEGRGYAMVSDESIMYMSKGESFFVPKTLMYSLISTDEPFTVVRCFSQGVKTDWTKVKTISDF